MDPRTAGRRDLTLIVIVVVAVSRAVDGPLLWLLGGLLLAAIMVGALQVLGEGEPRGVPIESLLMPGAAALAAVGGMRLVPIGLAMAPALVVAGVVIERALALEARLESQAAATSSEDRAWILIVALLVAFAAFAGAASIVPSGLAEPPGGAAATPIPAGDLLLLAAADAAVAGLLGYRIAALRLTTVREALGSAVTYSLVIAIAAGAVRALAVPRLLGPALLTLVFFLWASLNDTAPSRRRDPRWIWEMVLLGLLGLLVVGLNLRLPG